MDKELQEYLARISKDLTEVKGTVATMETTMATKKDLTAVEEKLSKKIDKVDRKLTKKIDETIEYVKVIDKDLSAHRRDTEVHVPGTRKA